MKSDVGHVVTQKTGERCAERGERVEGALGGRDVVRQRAGPRVSNGGQMNRDAVVGELGAVAKPNDEKKQRLRRSPSGMCCACD